MKFTPIISTKGSLDGISVSHNDMEVSFLLSPKHGGKKWVNLPGIFNSVNALFNNCSDEEQEDLYYQYSKLRDLSIYRKANHQELHDDLEDVLLTIHSILPIDGIIEWSGNSYPDFTIPESIGKTSDSGNYPTASSYDSKEYLELCGLSTVFKLSLPLTGSFMSHYKDLHPDPKQCNDFKEYLLIQLYRNVGLLECRPYKKLHAQAVGRITRAGEGVHIPMGILSSGIAEEEYPLFYLSYDLLRTLCLSETDISYRNNTGTPNNITAKLTSSLTTRQQTIERKFDYANTATPMEKSGGEGGNTSIQEDIHAIERFSSMYGRLFRMSYSQGNLHHRYGITDETYAIFQNHVTNYPATITTGKFVIIGRVLGDFAGIESLTLIPTEIVQKVVAVTAAYLHELKLYNLVNYLLSVEDTTVTADAVRSVVAQNTKPSPAIAAEFAEFFPTSHGDVNYGLAAIKEFAAEEVCGYHWIKFSPAELSPEYGINQSWSADRNFKDHLMMLVIATEERNKKA